MADKQFLQQLSKKLADQGNLIEAGWVGFRIAAMPQGASQAQITDTRYAFMAGAAHLFSSIMTVLDPEAEITEDDMRRMDLIHQELEAFGKELEQVIQQQGKRRAH